MTDAINIELVRSLLSAQRFIFSHSADQVWLLKLDFLIQSFNCFLDDFQQQLAVEECDVFEENHREGEKDSDENQIGNFYDSGMGENKIEESDYKKTDVKDENCDEEENNLESPQKVIRDLGPTPTCKLCNLKFTKKDLLTAHIDMVHKECDGFRCPEENCKKLYSTWTSLKNHFYGHSKNSLLICSECGESFTVKSKFVYHCKWKHANEKLPCGQCNKVFVNEGSLKAHGKVHEEDRVLTCDHCGREFANKVSLVGHIASAHKIGDGEYKCIECDKIFYNSSKFKQHMKLRHTDRSRFQCDQCEYSCSTKQEMNRHAIIHTGDEAKVISCPQCDSRFKTKDLLRGHIKKVHLQIRNHKCEICGKAFYSPEKLKRHMKIHTGEKDYTCQFCDKQFIQKCNMQLHERKVHAALC